MRKTNRQLRGALAVAAVIVGSLLARSGGAQSASGNPYWIDHISVCSDPCPSMQFENCRCIKLDPIVVVAS